MEGGGAQDVEDINLTESRSLRLPSFRSSHTFINTHTQRSLFLDPCEVRALTSIHFLETV